MDAAQAAGTRSRPSQLKAPSSLSIIGEKDIAQLQDHNRNPSKDSADQQSNSQGKDATGRARKWGHASSEQTFDRDADLRPHSEKPCNKGRLQWLRRFGSWSRNLFTPKPPKTPRTPALDSGTHQKTPGSVKSLPAIGKTVDSGSGSVTNAARQLALRAKAQLSKWSSYWKHPDITPPTPAHRVSQEEESSAEQSPWLWFWPEEPAPPPTAALRALEDLDAFLCKKNGSVPDAFVECPSQFTRFDLRAAMNIKQQTNKDDLTGSQKLKDKEIDDLYKYLLALHRRADGPIPLSELVSFPEVVKHQREMLQKLKLSGCTSSTAEDFELIGGHQLLQVVASGSFSKAEARELLAYLSLVLKVEPKRTLNAFLLSKAVQSRAGSGLRHVAQLMQFDSFSESDVDVILGGWAFYTQVMALAIELGPPEPPEPSAKPSGSNEKKANVSNVPQRAMKKLLAKNALAGKYKVKVDVGKKPKELDEAGHKRACHAALWKAFPPGRVLWVIRCAAENLCNSKFEQLVLAAWGLLDTHDAVCWLLGTVGIGRLRKELTDLFNLCLRWGTAEDDPTFVHAELADKKVFVVVQHLESLSAADNRLARVAALYGATFLLARIRSHISSLLDLTEDGFAAEQSRSDAAELNRAMESITSQLAPHVEHILHDKFGVAGSLASAASG